MRETSSKRHEVEVKPPLTLIEAMTADAGMGLPVAEEERQTDEMADPLAGISFGLTVIEALLLSVIDGHPVQGTDRRARLDAAMIALLNRRASHRPLPPDPNKAFSPLEVTTELALLWMGGEYASAGRRKPADLALATAAADKFFPTSNPEHRHSKIGDLRARFSGSYDKKLRRWDSTTAHDVRETYAYRATKHDYVAESVENQILRRLCDELAATGLRMMLPRE